MSCQWELRQWTLLCPFTPNVQFCPQKCHEMIFRFFAPLNHRLPDNRVKSELPFLWLQDWKVLRIALLFETQRSHFCGSDRWRYHLPEMAHDCALSQCTKEMTAEFRWYHIWHWLQHQQIIAIPYFIQDLLRVAKQIKRSRSKNGQLTVRYSIHAITHSN